MDPVADLDTVNEIMIAYPLLFEVTNFRVSRFLGKVKLKEITKQSGN